MKTLLEVCQAEPDRFKLFLVDIDGTVLLGKTPIPGAPEFIRYLRGRGIPFRFFSNNATQTKESLAQRMTAAGVEAFPEDFYTCADPLNTYFEENSRKAGRELRYFLLGRQDEIPGVISFEYDLEKLDTCDGVLLKDSHFDWRSVFSRLLNHFLAFPDSPFVVSNPDRMYPVRSGVLSFCAGSCGKFICSMLEECGIRKECVFIGKPYSPIYEGIRRHFAEIEDPRSIAGVGDFLGSDICGANRNGMTSVLVLTGMTSEEKALAAQGDFKPQLICRSLG